MVIRIPFLLTDEDYVAMANIVLSNIYGIYYCCDRIMIADINNIFRITDDIDDYIIFKEQYMRIVGRIRYALIVHDTNAMLWHLIEPYSKYMPVMLMTPEVNDNIEAHLVHLVIEHDNISMKLIVKTPIDVK